MEPRRYRAGESIEDFCRACKTDRMHTVVAADADGRPIRVDCGYCHSEHNYRGGARIGAAGPAPHRRRHRRPPGAPARRSRRHDAREPFPIVSERERTGPPMTPDRDADLELLLRRVIREETGITAGRAGRQMARRHARAAPRHAPAFRRRRWPIETFFHKVVMLRNRLRTLEQHVNSAELPDDVKVKLQGYISGCYGIADQLQRAVRGGRGSVQGRGGD